MGVPFEALLPYGIMLGVRSSLEPHNESFHLRRLQMFMFTGGALTKLRHVQNGGKRARHSIDQWDRQSTMELCCTKAWTPELITSAVMDRDRRLTGMLRGQTDKPEAPDGFELNSAWRVRTSLPFLGPFLTLFRWRHDTSRYSIHAFTRRSIFTAPMGLPVLRCRILPIAQITYQALDPPSLLHPQNNTKPFFQRLYSFTFIPTPTQLLRLASQSPLHYIAIE